MPGTSAVLNQLPVLRLHKNSLHHASPTFLLELDPPSIEALQEGTMTQPEQTLPSADMFRPPVNRAMRTLDRSFFQRDVMLAAACVLDPKGISKYQKELSKDVLKIQRLPPIRTVSSDVLPDKSAKGLLLRPEIRMDGRSPRSRHRILQVTGLGR